MKSGLCSITFRKHTSGEVISLVAEAGLDGIEWGSDVHVPPGNLENARAVGRQTRNAGLSVAGYGSYWFAFDKNQQPEPFEPLIEAATALGAPVIRVWAGSLHLGKSPDYFETVVEKSRAFAEAASQAHIKVAYEYHPGTFTETLDGTQKLLAAVNHPNLYTYWQSPHRSDLTQRLTEIAALNDRLLNLHVFHWEYTGAPPFPRLALADGSDLWKTCLAAIDPAVERFALLEFVRDDSSEQFKADAAALKSWLKT
jgi:sugar phosphate isomerase/epimerase